MAGDWIKLEHATPDKPEVFRIAEVLRIDPDAVVGKLIRFWRWCDQQTVDGNALTISDTVIDRLTHQPGFSAALREVSWLQARSSGSLAIPNFDRHNGQTAKARATENRKKASQRDRSRSESRNCPDVTGTNDGTETGTREEKRREDIKTGAGAAPISVEPAEEVPLPNVLLTEAFKAKWAEWIAYRKERRLPPLKPISIGKQWAEIAQWGHDAAIAGIEHSMRNNYQGIFPDKKGVNANNRTGSSRSFSQQGSFAGITDK